MPNRIAHHEPVCFLHDLDQISTTHLMSVYDKVMTLFSWMGIDSKSLLYGWTTSRPYVRR